MGMALHKAQAKWIEQEHRESLEGTTQERYKVQDNHNYQGTSEDRTSSLR